MGSSYKCFEVPKRSGGVRKIEAPAKWLKAYQRGLLDRLYIVAKPSPMAMGFVRNRNIGNNAKLHEGRAFVVSIDIKNFFPSISWEKFQKVVCPKIRTNLKKIIVRNKKRLFYDFNDKQGLRLPQGAPTSPYMSNLYLKEMDWRLSWIAQKANITYSRYADDLVFSGDDKKQMKRMLSIGLKMIKRYELEPNMEKVHFVSQGGRQMVTGLVVNHHANLPRKVRKNMRAAAFQARMAGKQLDRHEQGLVALKNMVDKAKRPDSNVEICAMKTVVKQI